MDRNVTGSWMCAILSQLTVYFAGVCTVFSLVKHLTSRKVFRSSCCPTTMSGCPSQSFSSSWKKHWRRRMATLRCLSSGVSFRSSSRGKNSPHHVDKDSTVRPTRMSSIGILSIQPKSWCAKVGCHSNTVNSWCLWNDQNNSVQNCKVWFYASATLWSRTSVKLLFQ